jgi:hypothetical protein
MKAVTFQEKPAEKIFVIVCMAIWRVIRLCDPYKFQRYFSARPSANSVSLSEVYSLQEKDAVAHICRLNNNRMKDGESCLAKRGDLIKIVNAETGAFVMRYVHGAGGEHRIRYNGIGLDYDAKLELGIVDQEQVNLLVSKANAADREFYLMYQDKSVSSRQSRALGWYILLGSIVISIAVNAIGLAVDLIKTLL